MTTVNAWCSPPGRYIGERFDDPRLDPLLLAMPIA
jgi:hypothetical protein